MYAELSYPFPGTTPAAFAHIAARDEMLRLRRIDEANRRAYRAIERRQGSRAMR